MKLRGPVFAPESGMYAEAQSVTVKADAGAVIYCTTHGSDPATSGMGTEYSGAIALSETATLRAAALENNSAMSPLPPVSLYRHTHRLGLGLREGRTDPHKFPGCRQRQRLRL